MCDCGVGIAPRVPLPRRRARCEIEPLHRRTRRERGNGRIGRRLTVSDDAAHHARRSQMPSETPGVNFLENRYLRVAQPAPQVATRAPIGGMIRELAHDDAGHLRLPRFRVVGIHAVVADHRRRHHDDLVAVRRIGEHFLITRHVRREHDLGNALHVGVAAQAAKKGSILEEEEPGSRARGRHGATSAESWSVVLPAPPSESD